MKFIKSIIEFSWIWYSSPWYLVRSHQLIWVIFFLSTTHKISDTQWFPKKLYKTLKSPNCLSAGCLGILDIYRHNDDQVWVLYWCAGLAVTLFIHWTIIILNPPMPFWLCLNIFFFLKVGYFCLGLIEAGAMALYIYYALGSYKEDNLFLGPL